MYKLFKCISGIHQELYKEVHLTFEQNQSYYELIKQAADENFHLTSFHQLNCFNC